MQTTYVFLFCLAIYTICSCSKSYDGLEQTDLLEITAVDTLNDLTFRAAPAINSITGPTYLPYVQNGKWQGNVPACGQGSYFGYYVINTHDNNAADNYWYINGSNFGSSAGSVTSSSSGVTLQVLTWSNTQIKVRPKATYLLDYKNNLTVKVITNSNGNVSKIINVLGMIKQGRGFGQCTWEAAFQRKQAGLSIPSSAYSYTNSINVAYVPQKHDITHWGTSHTAIIMTTPSVTVSNGVITYTFQLRERNHDCSENAVTTTKTFKKTATQVIQGIKSANSNFGSATKYFR